MLRFWILDFHGIPDPLSHPDLWDFLDSETYETMIAYKRPQNRMEQGAKWLLLKHAFEQEGLSLAEEVFHKTEEGKPYLASGRVQFNVSHSGHYVIAAISDQPVGCDIETARVFKESFLSRCFTDGERNWAGDDASRYTMLWTMKESFLKYIGKGLLVDLKSLEFHPKPTEIVSYTEKINPTEKILTSKHDLFTEVAPIPKEDIEIIYTTVYVEDDGLHLLRSDVDKKEERELWTLSFQGIQREESLLVFPVEEYWTSLCYTGLSI